MRKLLILGMLVFVGCASAPKFNKISIGMTKSEVINALGDPDTVAAKEGVEYMNYSHERHALGAFTVHEDYFVRLVGGKVESYGKRGDFDSTKVPEQTININKTERVVREPAAKNP